MKKIHIFKVGSHTSAAGDTIDFNESMLKGVADSYEPKTLHRAPIIVGHNEGASPAFGWIGGVEFNESGLYANPEELNPNFVDMVKTGAYKKVSASFYSENSPTNPTPGKLHLRHLAFLGAQPPAVKGLEEVQFSEDDGGIDINVDFEFSEEKGFFKSMSDTLAALVSRTEKLESKINFNESKEGDDVTNEELQAKLDEANAEAAKLKADKEALESKVNDYSEKTKQARSASIADKVSALIEAGKVLPKNKPLLMAFFENIEEGKTIEFGEGEDKKEQALDEAAFAMFEEMNPIVDFGERSPEGEPQKLPTAEDVRNFSEKHYKETGVQISGADAYNMILQGGK